MDGAMGTSNLEDQSIRKIFYAYFHKMRIGNGELLTELTAFSLVLALHIVHTNPTKRVSLKLQPYSATACGHF